MKYLLLTTVSLTFCMLTFSQSVIELEDFTPEFGEEIPMHKSEYVNPGEGGENQIWDFSNLPITGDFIISVDDPINFTWPQPSLEGTTHVLISTSSGDREYVRFADNRKERLFVDEPDYVVQNYQEAELILQFPLQYGNTFEDDYVKVRDPLEDYASTEYGHVSSTVDGFGTLVLPSGSFENVFRITNTTTGTRVQETISDTYTWEFSRTETRYVVAGIHVDLLRFTTSQVVNGFTVTSAVMIAGEPLDLNRSESITNFKLYPSPASTFIQMDFNLESTSEVTLKLMTVDGRIVEQDFLGMISAGNNQVRLDLPTLSAGVYLLHVLTGDGVYAHRLLIE